LFLVLVVFSPDEITLWEAVITLMSFPILVMNSYMAEKNFFLKVQEEDVEHLDLEQMCN
jgi:hypothetical protein